jgi:PIN domain nuclease of toxin-antitoxin system
LPAPATAALSDPAHDRLLSVVTLWEIGVKLALGKLSLSKPFRAWVQTAITDLVLTEFPIALEHVERMMSLPFHHRDPFDRLLAAQSLAEGFPLIGADTVFDAYGVNRIWN